MQASLERLKARREQGEGGFTLIELLIVIVILGILAAIVVFAVQNLSKSSSQASCGSDVKTVETAVEAYKAQIGVYPVASGSLPAGVTVGTSSTAANGKMPQTGANGINDLLTTYTVNGNSVGPWLKDVPANPSHYAIGVAEGLTTGAITVYNGTGTTAAATASGCSAITG
jgi:general secretion pathway protein G